MNGTMSVRTYKPHFNTQQKLSMLSYVGLGSDFFPNAASLDVKFLVSPGKHWIAERLDH